MTTRTDFLLARIADDEEVARSAWQATFERGQGAMSIDSGDVMAHVTRHDPDRVLAECEAKRRIVARHSEGEMYCGWSQDSMSMHGPGDDCEELLALAAVYASHPDYQAEWAIA